ncbi:MAG: hypothetical protein CMJ59_20650 [Planctomycetaceae bacterium]|nr:hypothetical protein [Planctomycetaceae bacterium]
MYSRIQLRVSLLYRTWGLLFCLMPTGHLWGQEQAAQPRTAQNAKDSAEMILVPSGQFLMGSTPEDVGPQFTATGLPEAWKKYTDDEAPRHARTIDAFYMYRYEVTNGQYHKFTTATGHRTPPHWKGPDPPTGKDDHPVVEVSWDDARAYCRWAGTQLPSEAQWEYAARGAGSQDAEGQLKPGPAFPWGNKWDRQLCNNSSYHAGRDLVSADGWTEWYDGKQKVDYPLTTKGGSFPESRSPFGIDDMAGNAWEWCLDYQLPYQTDTLPTDSTLRSRRGGSWANVALHLRSADRQGAAAGNLNLYTGFRCVRPAGKPRTQGPVDVQQAGDRFVNFVLHEIEAAAERMSGITRAANRAADRIVHLDGKLLSAGDQSFSLEPVWRAGGIAFSRQYTPAGSAAGFKKLDSPEDKVPYYRTEGFVEHFTVKTATANDVVLLGFENETEERKHAVPLARQLLDDKALVIFFGSAEGAQRLEKAVGPNDNLMTVTHTVPDGGVISVKGWPEKICSGRSIANRLYLWTFEAELIGAFLRRGKMPGILLSVTYESPQIFNQPLLNKYKFVPAFNVTPVKEGQLGRTYLGHIDRIVGRILDGQRHKFRKAARWLAEAARKKQTSYALLIHGLDPENLPGDPGLFKVFSEGNAYYPQMDTLLKPDDVALFVGYNWFPRRLAKTVDKAQARQILCFTLVDEAPPNPALYGEVGELYHPTSFDQLPQGENRIYIDLRFAQYNAVLKIPGFPVPALETSSFAEDVVYWHLVADTIELLGTEAR